MASSSSGAAPGGNAKQQWHRECTMKPGSSCVLSNGTKTAQQEKWLPASRA